MGPMDGVKVVELGFWVAGPACGGILADWGATVTKVEPLTGDPFRGFGQYLASLYGASANAPFELDNRGKRSIGLDYVTEAGKAVLLDLIDQADVFLTNLRVGALERAGLDYPSLSARNPRLIYASVTGLGLEGPEAHRAAYDVGAFWARAGIAAALTPPDQDLPYQRGGMGDHMTGMAMAGGVSAALYEREKTGAGRLVATSLLRIGTYMMGWDTNVALRIGAPVVAGTRDRVGNPLLNCYEGNDGQRFWLLGLEGDRHWPNLMAALGDPEWGNDPTCADTFTRSANCAEIIVRLDEAFAAHPRDEWGVIFDEHGVWWAPVQHAHELPADPQARAAGCFVDTPLPDGTTAEMVATPIDFGTEGWAPARPCPEFGQHTEDVLLDLGYEWERIIELKEIGAIL